MSDQKEPAIDKCMTAAKSRRCTVKLNELVPAPERFCHREDAELSPDGLKLLKDSIVLEKLQHPIEYYVDPEGKKIPTKGYRRLAALLQLAKENVPGFSADMEIEAIEVLEANDQDLLVRSIMDNENRVNLDAISRIRAAKKLHDAKVPRQRAARALGVVVKTYERALIIGEHDWMYEWVVGKCIQSTDAANLLEAGKGKNRLDDLRHCMEGKIAEIKTTIQEEETQHKQVTGKDLPANRKVISKRLGTAVSNWLEQLKNDGPICEVGQWNFAAGIDPKAHQLRISALTLDLENDDMTKVAKVASRLSMIAKQLPAYLLRRRALEKAVGGVPTPTGLDDTTMLRDLGLDDLAQELEQDAKGVAAMPASEDADDLDTEEVEERNDADEEEIEPEESSSPAPPPLPQRPAQVKTPPAKDRSSPPLKKIPKAKEG